MKRLGGTLAQHHQHRLGANRIGAPRCIKVLIVFYCVPYRLAMPNEPHLRPATPDEIATALSFALQFEGRKRVHHADDAIAVHQLFRKRSPARRPKAPDLFALAEERPLACFAGIWTTWTSVRKVKEGETTNDLCAFLTTEPNALVGTYHPKAMPVILRSQDEIDIWMDAPGPVALQLQRPLPDDTLMIVARDAKQDP